MKTLQYSLLNPPPPQYRCSRDWWKMGVFIDSKGGGKFEIISILEKAVLGPGNEWLYWGDACEWRGIRLYIYNTLNLVKGT